ncbi:MAG: DegT/DnrJ/EryC1/StrS family aminotransferase [Helicobacteraceae bacterium]
MQTIPFMRPNFDEMPEIYNQKAIEDPASLPLMLEEKIRSFINVPYAVCVNNTFAAFHLGLSAIDLKRGDKVIISVNSHPILASAIRHFDAEPIFIDIAEDLNIDLDLVEQLLSNNPHKKLRGMIVSFLGGEPADLERIYALAKKYHIFIIEDATHALGGKYNGKRIGSLDADFTIFSFAPLNSPAFGNGAVIVTKNEQIHNRAHLLREYAVSRKDGDLPYLYDVLDMGFDYRLSAINAAFCLEELDNLDQDLALRRKIAAAYTRALQDKPGLSLRPFNERHTYYSFILRVDKNRDGFAKLLLKDGVQTSLQYIPLHILTYYKTKYGLKINSFPKALRAYSQTLSLPIYAKLHDEEQEAVIASIIKTLNTKLW